MFIRHHNVLQLARDLTRGDNKAAELQGRVTEKERAQVREDNIRELNQAREDKIRERARDREDAERAEARSREDALQRDARDREYDLQRDLREMAVRAAVAETTAQLQAKHKEENDVLRAKAGYWEGRAGGAEKALSTVTKADPPEEARNRATEVSSCAWPLLIPSFLPTKLTLFCCSLHLNSKADGTNLNDVFGDESAAAASPTVTRPFVDNNETEASGSGGGDDGSDDDENEEDEAGEDLAPLGQLRELLNEPREPIAAAGKASKSSTVGIQDDGSYSAFDVGGKFCFLSCCIDCPHLNMCYACFIFIYCLLNLSHP